MTETIKVDAYATGKRHAEQGIRFYLPENCSDKYRERYADGYVRGRPITPDARECKFRGLAHPAARAAVCRLDDDECTSNAEARNECLTLMYRAIPNTEANQ